MTGLKVVSVSFRSDSAETGNENPRARRSHQIIHVDGKRGTTRADRDPVGPVLMVYGDKRYLSRRIADFLKKQAKADIEPLVARHASASANRSDLSDSRIQPAGGDHVPPTETCLFPGES